MSKRFFSQQSHTARSAAREILKADGARLHLITASLFCLALGAGSIFLTENLFATVPWARLYNTDRLQFDTLNALFYLMDALVVLLVVLPLVYGLLSVFMATARGHRLPARTIFSPFRGLGHYLRAVARMAAIVLPRVAAAAAFVWLLRRALAQPTLPQQVGGVLVCLALLILLLWLLGLSDGLLWLSLQEQNEKRCLLALLLMSARLTWRHLGRMLRFKLSFLHWGLFSLASVGVLFFLHAFPYYVLSHLLLMEGLSNKGSPMSG